MSKVNFSRQMTHIDIINKTKAMCTKFNIKPPFRKYRFLVLHEAEKYPMIESEVKKLANHLQIPWTLPPRFAKTWTASICMKYLSPMYTNPEDPREFVICVSGNTNYGTSGIIHHLPSGYVDVSWFTEFIPALEEISAQFPAAIQAIPENLPPRQLEAEKRKVTSRIVNDTINQEYDEGLTRKQLRIINAFFQRYLPGLDGICEKCFKLSLPSSGFGERWSSPETKNCEIRLSEPKPQGRPHQQILYVSHKYEINEKVLHVKWDGIVSDDPPELVTNHKQPQTHIPWKFYEYQEVVPLLPKEQDIEVCQCNTLQ